jgi:HEAT repeat protein
VSLDEFELRRLADETRRGLDPGHPAFVRATLEAHEVPVFACAAEARVLDALLAEGVPVLLYRIERVGDEYRDRPHLVTGRERTTGLWMLDEPDVSSVDALPRDGVQQAWCLLAAPPGRSDLLQPFRGAPGADLGRRIERLRTAEGEEEVARALQALVAEPAPPLAWLYGAWTRHREAERRRDERELAAAAEWMASAGPPRLGIQPFVLALAHAVARRQDEARDAFALTHTLEGPSAELALARFAGLGRDLLARASEAAAALDEGVRQDPGDLRLLAQRAALRRALGEIEGARADLVRARDLDPASVELALALADLELTAGREREALAVLDDAARQSPAVATNDALRAMRRRVEAHGIEGAGDVNDLREHRRSREPETRQRLAYELANRGDAAAEEVLRKLLEDPDAVVRVTVLRLYLRPRLREHVAADEVLGRRVLDTLASDPEPEVRAAAAALLGRVPSPLSLRALAAAASGAARDRSAYVREEALQGLALTDLPVTREALVAALEDPTASVRRVAAESLFRLASTRLGFDAEGPAEERAEAVVRWRRWLAGGD